MFRLPAKIVSRLKVERGRKTKTLNKEHKMNKVKSVFDKAVTYTAEAILLSGFVYGLRQLTTNLDLVTELVVVVASFIVGLSLLRRVVK